MKLIELKNLTILIMNTYLELEAQPDINRPSKLI